MRVTLLVNKNFILVIILLCSTQALISIASKDSSLPSSLKKQKEALRVADNNKLRISYKLSNDEIRTPIGDSILPNSTSFVLVKDITHLVILGTPFIEELIPFRVSNQGIEIWKCQYFSTF